MRILLGCIAFVIIGGLFGCGGSAKNKGGCTTDNDCKGDRICVNGDCTEPSNAAGPDGSVISKRKDSSVDASWNAAKDGGCPDGYPVNCVSYCCRSQFPVCGGCGYDCCAKKVGVVGGTGGGGTGGFIPTGGTDGSASGGRGGT